MKVGLVGTGLVGNRRAKVVKQFEDTDLIMVADVDIERAKLVAEEFGCEVTANWEEVVTRDDVDVIIVSTPHKFLAPISIEAMNNGKHVLCEKPLGRNPDEVKEMVEVAQANRVKLKTGFNHRHHLGIQKARELVDAEVIGELNFIRCCYGHGGRPGYEKEWRANAEIAGGGEMLDQGVHAIDLFRWFLGDFCEVVGFTATRFWDIAPVEDNAFALFRTERGQIASLHASWTQWKNLFSFEIFGQDGYVLVNGLGGSYGTEHIIWGKRRPQSGPPLEERFDFPGDDISWHEEWKEFVAAIREDREPMANGYDGWQAVRMVYAVYESNEKGCVVKL